MRRGPTIHRFLDPGDALGEMLFGIIMSLTFTVGARFFLAKGEFDRHDLIVGAIGCNLAWGVIDAVLYVLGSVFLRSQRARLFRTLRSTSDEKVALAAVEEQFGLENASLNIAAADRAQIYRTIMTIGRRSAPARIRVTRDDEIAGAIEQARSIKGPVVIEFVVEPEANVWPMVPAGASNSDMMLGQGGK